MGTYNIGLNRAESHIISDIGISFYLTYSRSVLLWFKDQHRSLVVICSPLVCVKMVCGFDPSWYIKIYIKIYFNIGYQNGLWCQSGLFHYRNDSFQPNIFSSDIRITDVHVQCRISPTLRSMSMPTYAFYQSDIFTEKIAMIITRTIHAWGSVSH